MSDGRRSCDGELGELTDLDVSLRIEKNVVALDVAMNDALRVKVLEPFAGLREGTNRIVSSRSKVEKRARRLASFEMLEI